MIKCILDFGVDFIWDQQYNPRLRWVVHADGGLTVASASQAGGSKPQVQLILVIKNMLISDWLLCV